jgi:hypothetical protein
MLFGLATALVSGGVRADDAQVNQVLDKAIQALGGEEKLSKAMSVSWKSKSKVTIEGNENEMSSEVTTQGLDHQRVKFEGEFNGNKVEGLSILNGEKGWRKFGGNIMEMDEEAIKNEKRNLYLAIVGTSVLPLKGKGFKAVSAPDETIGGKPAAALDVTGPDGKTFKLYYDKASGLPVRQVAKVVGWTGEEYTQEVNYSDYKDFGGLKKPTKLAIKRDGEEFVQSEITEFKVLDTVPGELFAEPK